MYGGIFAEVDESLTLDERIEGLTITGKSFHKSRQNSKLLKVFLKVFEVIVGVNIVQINYKI